LFWKRKTDNGQDTAGSFSQGKKADAVETDLFEYKQNDRRGSFRIRPSKTEPILFRFSGQVVRVSDISAAGISFPDGGFSVGDSHTADIDLPGFGPSVPAELHIVAIDEHGICHTEFTHIESKAMERIHKYVLKRQKEVLQEERAKYKRKITSIVEVKPDDEKPMGR
jgi:hypothetical protein